MNNFKSLVKLFNTSIQSFLLYYFLEKRSKKLYGIWNRIKLKDILASTCKFFDCSNSF